MILIICFVLPVILMKTPDFFLTLNLLYAINFNQDIEKCLLFSVFFGKSIIEAKIEAKESNFSIPVTFN